MDWFSWLSKAPLDPPFIHEYAIVFSHNQLQQEDIPYFNHEFLQSMGIAIAKHRLEILKLAKASVSNSSSKHHPIAKLIAAIKATNRSLAGCVRTWVHHRRSRRDSAALVVAQRRRSYSSRWKGAMLKRGASRLVMTSSSAVKDGGSAARLLLTDGNGRRWPPVVVGSGGGGGGKVNNSFSSPMVYNVYECDDHGEDKADDGGEIDCFSDGEDGGGGGDGGGYWTGTGGEEIKWDAMFQNLKPT